MLTPVQLTRRAAVVDVKEIDPESTKLAKIIFLHVTK